MGNLRWYDDHARFYENLINVIYTPNRPRPIDIGLKIELELGRRIYALSSLIEY
jgi:hypothetical protein